MENISKSRLWGGHARTLHWHQAMKVQLVMASRWMCRFGKVPNVTADLIRKASYPTDEHVADAAEA